MQRDVQLAEIHNIQPGSALMADGNIEGGNLVWVCTSFIGHF